MKLFLTAEARSYSTGHYPFSGGQIDNISRECAVEFILDGRSPEMDVIGQTCIMENIQENKRPLIGF